MVLNAPSADHIWLASCATAEGLPPVPDDISLGEFVRLVYKKGCRVSFDRVKLPALIA